MAAMVSLVASLLVFTGLSLWGTAAPGLEESSAWLSVRSIFS